MARMPRIKIDGAVAGYHVVTRTRGREFLLGSEMKLHFIKLLKKLKELYFVEYGAFAILDNHYHLLLQFNDAEDIDADIAMERWNSFHADTEFVRNPASEGSRKYVIDQLSDISSFMKRLNYHLTARYNWLHGTQGTLWERRFRSSIIEKGWAFINCAAYIELNAFRASLVRQPEQYPFGSLHYVGKGNPEDLLSMELLADGLLLAGRQDVKEIYRTFKAFVYETGTSPHRDHPNGLVVSQEMRDHLQRHGLQPEKGSFCSRTAAWIHGKVTAGMGLTREIYDIHIDPGLSGSRAHRHAAKWIRGAGEALWSAYSGLERGSP